MGSGIKYSPEFRLEAVRLVTEVSRPVKDVAAEVGVDGSTLRGWIRRARLESMSKDEIEESELQAENRKLKKELTDSRMENEFLKKAAAFFASDNNKPGTG